MKKPPILFGGFSKNLNFCSFPGTDTVNLEILDFIGLGFIHLDRTKLRQFLVPAWTIGQEITKLGFNT